MRPRNATRLRFALRLFYAGLIWLFVLSAALFVLLSVVFGLLSWSSQDVSGSPKLSAMTVGTGLIGIGLLVVIFEYWRKNEAQMLDSRIFAASVVLAGVTLLFHLGSEVLRRRSLNASYALRRFLERYFECTFVPGLVILIVGLIPAVPYYMIHFAGKTPAALSLGGIAAGAVSLVGGVASSLYGYYTLARKIDPGLSGRIFAPVGAAAYLYGTVVLAYIVAVFVFEVLANNDSTLINQLAGKNSGDVRLVIQAASLFTILLAFILGWTANINFVGLHRFYRDRLMEAFMPSRDAVVRGRADFSPIADRLLLSDLVSSVKPDAGDPTRFPSPYPLINTIAIFNDVDRRITGRGGDNFVLSPLFVGSALTGWERADIHTRRYGPLTVATAMAASGAAVNANAGYIGTGVTRDRLVSAVMTVLNMRLGVWIGNPGNRGTRPWKRVPTFLSPMMGVGLFGWGHRRTSPFVELADGGDFENLGLYELVRRKLGVIVVIDGEADSTLALPALVSAINRIEEDFKATVSFIADSGPERFVPGAAGQDYPAGVRYARAPFLVATITYADNSQGALIYIKATMIKNLNFTTSGYWAGNQTFPHQSTADQFFPGPVRGLSRSGISQRGADGGRGQVGAVN